MKVVPHSSQMPPPNLNPVVIFVMGLFATAAMTDVESCRQSEQWRSIRPPPASAQSAARLRCAIESEINRIVPVGARLITLNLPGTKRADGAYLQRNSDSISRLIAERTLCL